MTLVTVPPPPPPPADQYNGFPAPADVNTCPVVPADDGKIYEYVALPGAIRIVTVSCKIIGLKDLNRPLVLLISIIT